MRSSGYFPRIHAAPGPTLCTSPQAILLVPGTLLYVTVLPTFTVPKCSVAISSPSLAQRDRRFCTAKSGRQKTVLFVALRVIWLSFLSLRDPTPLHFGHASRRRDACRSRLIGRWLLAALVGGRWL